MMASRSCTHIDQVQPVVPQTLGCGECLKTGDSWRALRLCLYCGFVGCSDDSKNQHALRHWQETYHAVVQSFESGEVWRWCYVDRVYI